MVGASPEEGTAGSVGCGVDSPTPFSWTRPTSTEVGIVLKAGLAAGLAWWVASLITDVRNPLLAPLTAVVTVRVSVRSSVSRAVLRSGAVVFGVLVALAIGDTVRLNGVTIALLVAGSLAIAELLFRLPLWAATQVPISILVVLGAVATPETSDGWGRAVDTLIGAAVGVAVSLLLPASRRVDARQTLDRLAVGLEQTLDTMGQGLGEPWTRNDTTEWRHEAHVPRSIGPASARGSGRQPGGRSVESPRSPPHRRARAVRGAGAAL